MHARAQRAILVNAPFQNAKWYFGYCQISLNTEKIIILSIFFCKNGGLTQRWCYLAICDKITIETKLCWGDIIIVKYGSHVGRGMLEARQHPLRFLFNPPPMTVRCCPYWQWPPSVYPHGIAAIYFLSCFLVYCTVKKLCAWCHALSIN